MQSGFFNHFSSEAIDGALPIGQNSPQMTPFGLYAEQFSATAFTAPRAQNRRTWFYRLRPSAARGAYSPITAPSGWNTLGPAPSPNRVRWSPFALSGGDFVETMHTIAHNADVAISVYAASQSMTQKAMFNADAEMLLVAQSGVLEIVTECGILTLGPEEIALIPRGMVWQINSKTDVAKGYALELFSGHFTLPERGPLGANGLANERDFLAPNAAFEDKDEAFTLIQKFSGQFWRTELHHSPFDVVAWHGNSAPLKYALKDFNTVNTVSFDHPDPSIFTVLTAPSDTAGVALCDFVIFPPRWMVAEHTFRPPWFHRNIMSEFMGLLTGAYDAKGEGFAPFGASLHNAFSAHGPDLEAYQTGVAQSLSPQRYKNTMAFMFETRTPLAATDFALQTPALQADYDGAWHGFPKAKI